MAAAALETARLTLRPFTAADAPDHRRLYGDPEVTRYLAGGPFLGAAAAARSQRALEHFARHWGEHGFGVWAVVDRATRRPIGQCGLNRLPDRPEVEVLYALERAFWGRGLAAEAAAAAIHYGFEVVGLPRVVAVVFHDNEASRRVLEKVGMTCEGDVTVDGGGSAACYAITRASARARAPIGADGP